MQSQLIDSKSLLAKLMATENLVVEQRKVPTAFFDVESRVLVIPQLDKNISGYLYDLFVGHEVGHALYTPLDGMRKAHDMKIPSAVVNLVEDCRIERKIKSKYPGIRNSFVKGYKELLDKDFFGTQGVDLNTLPFLDRMNMFTKGGPAQGIIFSNFEKSLVEMAEKTETYEDVIEVATLIAKYAKEEKEAKRQQMLEEGVMDEEDDFDFDGEEGEDGEFGLNDFEGEDGEESETDPSEDGTGENDDSSEEDSSPSGTSSGHDGEDDATDDIRSVTDDNYKRNESKLFAQDDTIYYYGNIPKVDLDEVILDHKELYKRYHDDMKGRFRDNEPALAKYQKLRKDANKVVSYLAQEFEMRKNADQLKRASTAKTGDLNMNKIYSYQFSEDIFKKITVLPGGKSHGLVMFIDWSGSMSNHLENTVKQLLSLVLFCKKVNIPYEVYAFTQEYDTVCPKVKVGDIDMRQFKLLNLLSSRMTSLEFTYAASVLVDVSSSKYTYSRIFAMGGTPLNEAIISAMEIVPAFQKKYKLQVVNTVFLTDGEGHRLDHVWQDSPNGPRSIVGNLSDPYGYGKTRPRLILRDPVTKHQVMVEDYTCQKNSAAYLELLKLRTKCNTLGFYVLSGREFGRAAYVLLPRATNYDEMKIKFRKEKSLVITSAGFDEYYMLRSEALDTDEDATFEVKENATTRGLVSAFSKYAGNRLSNRVVLNRFIGMIS